MIDFDEACNLVEKKVSRTWSSDNGTLAMADYGWKSPDYWQPVWGAREWLQDRDSDYVLMDAPIYLVSKADGSIVVRPWDSIFTRTGFSTVGKVPTK